MLTRWMNPAAVNQVLRTIDNSLENFTELLEEERQTAVGFWQVPENTNTSSSEILLLKVWFMDPKQYTYPGVYLKCGIPGPTSHLQICSVARSSASFRYTLELKMHSSKADPVTHTCSKSLDFAIISSSLPNVTLLLKAYYMCIIIK